MLKIFPSSGAFSLTDDDHLLHNVFTGVAWRITYFLQLGMSDFLRRNPH